MANNIFPHGQKRDRRTYAEVLATGLPKSRNTSDPPVSNPRGLPRELRDIIYGLVAEDEGRRFKLKTARRPFRGARLIARSKTIQASKQLHDEYQDTLRTKAMVPLLDQDSSFFRQSGIMCAGESGWVLAFPDGVLGPGKSLAIPLEFDEEDRDPSISYEPFFSRLPINSVSTFVQDMHFAHIIDFLTGLAAKDLQTLRYTRKLQISFRFTATSDARRVDLQEWLRFCKRTGVEAEYGASKLMGSQAGSPRQRATYVNIYDLFSTKTEGGEEEKIFSALQDWYATRDAFGRLDYFYFEYAEEKGRCRAVDEGLRKSRASAECLHRVRVEPSKQRGKRTR